MRSMLQINRSLAKTTGMSSSDISEEALLEEWALIQEAQQQPAAFRPLYERYFESIFRFVFRRTNDEHLTADLCSQVFLQALQKLPQYTYRGVPFSAWLYRIAMNEVAMHYRREKRQRVVGFDEAPMDTLIDELQKGDDLPPLQPVLDALDQLKEVDMQLMELRYFEQRPYREIAQILDMTENNAKVRVHRILERLRRRLRH